MRSLLEKRASWLLAGTIVCARALSGCEAILGTGSLEDRRADAGGGADSTARSGDGGGSHEAGAHDATTTDAKRHDAAPGDAGHADAAGDAAFDAVVPPDAASDSGADVPPIGEAGADGAGDAGAPPQCEAGATDCINGNQPRECRSGHWVAAEVCPVSCVNGHCTECTPGGPGQCVGQQPQSCDPDGGWVDEGSPCASTTCVGGHCVGDCAPGQYRCATGDVDGGAGNPPVQAQACSDAGWVFFPACTKDYPVCAKVCGDSGVGCDGGPVACDCNENQTECFGGTVYVCESNGQYMSIGEQCTP